MMNGFAASFGKMKNKLTVRPSSTSDSGFALLPNGSCVSGCRREWPDWFRFALPAVRVAGIGDGRKYGTSGRRRDVLPGLAAIASRPAWPAAAFSPGQPRAGASSAGDAVPRYTAISADRLGRYRGGRHTRCNGPCSDAGADADPPDTETYRWLPHTETDGGQTACHHRDYSRCGWRARAARSPGFRRPRLARHWSIPCRPPRARLFPVGSP